MNNDNNHNKTNNSNTSANHGNCEIFAIIANKNFLAMILGKLKS